MSDRTLGLVAKTPQRMHPNKTELKSFSSHCKTRWKVHKHKDFAGKNYSSTIQYSQPSIQINLILKYQWFVKIFVLMAILMRTTMYTKKLLWSWPGDPLNPCGEYWKLKEGEKFIKCPAILTHPHSYSCRLQLIGA